MPPEPWKVVAGEHRQDDREVEGEQPDERHHQQRQPQLLAAAGVAQPGPDPAGCAAVGRWSR